VVYVVSMKYGIANENLLVAAAQIFPQAEFRKDSIHCMGQKVYRFRTNLPTYLYLYIQGIHERMVRFI
jgi:hypothetical protein